MAAAVIFGALALWSCNPVSESPDSGTGEKLVNQLWDYFLKKDTAALAVFIAEDFQSVHENGSGNKEQELELVKGLGIHSYNISDLRVTSKENVIVATYMVSVEETIDGLRLSKEPAARMSVFVKDGQDWKWLAHANLKPLEDETETQAIQDSVK